MGFEGFILIIGILVVCMVGVSLMFKQYEKMQSPNAHDDYELWYAAPGSAEQVLLALSDGENPAGTYSFYTEDTQTLVVGRSRLGGHKGYRVQLQEKGAHCILTLTLETFTAVGSKVDMDTFMRSKLKAEPIPGKNKQKP